MLFFSLTSLNYARAVHIYLFVAVSFNPVGKLPIKTHFYRKQLFFGIYVVQGVDKEARLEVKRFYILQCKVIHPQVRQRAGKKKIWQICPSLDIADLPGIWGVDSATVYIILLVDPYRYHAVYLRAELLSFFFTAKSATESTFNTCRKYPHLESA